ncbi:MAG: hypothetical protein N3F11_10565 [Casimicrobiaceae bacterium]|nr:hypothetical protein [Casimicrobiaceae bacterium]
MSLTALLLTAILIGAAALALRWLWRSHRREAARALSERLAWIARYRFPPALENRLVEALPQLDRSAREQVLEHLRAYFLLVATRPGERLGMPSKAVDTAWHEFILLTRDYSEFCARAFGRDLHHAPHDGDLAARDAALGQTRYAIEQSRVQLAALGAGPIAGGAAMTLFELDEQLGIPGGFSYTAEDFERFERARQAARNSGSAETFVADGGRAAEEGPSGQGPGGDDGGGCSSG